jgi:predicted transcriptional regulator
MRFRSTQTPSQSSDMSLVTPPPATPPATPPTAFDITQRQLNETRRELDEKRQQLAETQEALRAKERDLKTAMKAFREAEQENKKILNTFASHVRVWNELITQDKTQVEAVIAESEENDQAISAVLKKLRDQDVKISRNITAVERMFENKPSSLEDELTRLQEIRRKQTKMNHTTKRSVKALQDKLTDEMKRWRDQLSYESQIQRYPELQALLDPAQQEKWARMRQERVAKKREFENKNWDGKPPVLKDLFAVVDEAKPFRD